MSGGSFLPRLRQDTRSWPGAVAEPLEEDGGPSLGAPPLAPQPVRKQRSAGAAAAFGPEAVAAPPRSRSHAAKRAAKRGGASAWDQPAGEGDDGGDSDAPPAPPDFAAVPAEDDRAALARPDSSLRQHTALVVRLAEKLVLQELLRMLADELRE